MGRREKHTYFVLQHRNERGGDVDTVKHTDEGGGEILDLGVGGFGLRMCRYILHPDSLLNRISSSEH